MATSTLKNVTTYNPSITYSSFTLNSNYWSAGDGLYAKIGNIALVTLSNAVLKTDVGGGIVKNIMSGLPAPIQGCMAFLIMQYGTDEVWRIVINADGSVQSHYDAQTAKGSQWYMNITYLCV